MRPISVVVYLSAFALGASAFGADWRPIDPAILQLKEPKIQKDADAEAIFWETSIEDRLQGQELQVSFDNYVRLKIYTDRGVKEHATVEIPVAGKRYITDVSGRTIKANGSIVELKKDSIFDRDLVKTKGFKMRGKSFALPQVEPGDVIEYRYREVRDDEAANYLQLLFQREIPIWHASYQLKPLNLPWLPFGMRAMPFNVQPSPWERSKTRAGFMETHVDNAPAYKDEPFSPPPDVVRAWMLIYYEEDRKLDAEKFWRSVGKSTYNESKERTKADGSVKKVAEELVTGIDKSELKLAALERFCRTKIRNINSRVSGVTAEERKEFKFNPNPASTLKQKIGTGRDINFLFVALAQAAGIDARMARVPDRGRFFFNPTFPTTYFMNSMSVAAKVNEEWKMYDPATEYLPPGSLRWQEEGLQALVSDPKDGFFITTPFTPPAGSAKKRTADLELLEDGTLQGTIRYEYTGHVAVDEKNRLEDLSENERLEDTKDSLLSRLSTAEISDLKLENAVDPVKPVTVSCRISVPGYATRTGKRLLLQPAFFQRNLAAMFATGAREQDIYFRYGWSEEDEVKIKMPEGWVLDKAMSPGSYKVDKIGSYEVDLFKARESADLIYKRKFVWGSDGSLMIPKASYEALKGAFDKMHEQDNHVITLKPESGLSSGSN